MFIDEEEVEEMRETIGNLHDRIAAIEARLAVLRKVEEVPWTKDLAETIMRRICKQTQAAVKEAVGRDVVFPSLEQNIESLATLIQVRTQKALAALANGKECG